MVRTVTTLDGFVEVLTAHETWLVERGPDHDPTGSLDLRDLHFVGVDFLEANMIGADLAGSSVSGSDLTNVYATSTRWLTGRIVDSGLRKANLSHSTFEDVAFERVSLLRAEFLHCNFKRVSFVGCDLTKARLTYGDFEDVVFVDCTFDRTFFDESTFAGVAVRNPTKAGRVFFADVTTTSAPEVDDIVAMLG